jgi:putative transposase
VWKSRAEDCAFSKPRAFMKSRIWKGRNQNLPLRSSFMITLLRHIFGWIIVSFGSRKDLILENIALRQQLLALHAKRPRRRLSTMQKLFWVVLRRLWSGWQKPLILVTPRTVVEWRRAGFRLYWTWVSRARRVGGRRRVSKEVRALICRMATENPTWGAPRIHGELLKLGLHLSEITVSRWRTEGSTGGGGGRVKKISLIVITP